MTCQACASRIEKVLNKKDFVQQASVNFAAETAHIVFDNSQTTPAQLLDIIAKTGFQAALMDNGLPENLLVNSSWQTHWRTCLLLVLVMPFMLGMVGMLWGSHALMPPIWFQAVLASVVQLCLAVPFYRSAWASVRGGLANMDVLVCIGTTTIYGYSMLMAWLGQTNQVYFEAGVMVIAFVSLGKYWEDRTKRGSLNSLALMMRLTPKQVLVWRDEQWQTVALDKVQIGDTLRCVAGGRIAADGTVLSGEAWADESHLTGESLPVHKSAGSKVLAGSLLSGSLDYCADALGQHTLLGDTMTALAQAQEGKAPIARLADKVASVFVPVVLGIACITFGTTYWFSGSLNTALLHAVSVLVVACPCALGLATPAAMMAGMGVAVRHGVRFKNAAALERTGSIDTLVFDKTGTLTQGKPSVADIWFAPDVQPDVLFQAALAVSTHSQHPLSHTLATELKQRQVSLLQAHNVQHDTGAGLMAQVDNIGNVRMGKPEYCGFRLPENWGGVWHNASIVALSVNDKVAGAFALLDTLKSDSQAAIARLQASGLQIHLLSGDRVAVVAHIAKQLGIPASYALAEQTPRQKNAWIVQQQESGAKVAMIGDGINDVAALASADVGFAVKGSSDAAEHSADVILLQPSLHQLAEGIFIAQATLRVIKQNLFFAFFYNILGIPLAAFGLLTPMLAGAMMALSSLSVLGNALRLRRYLAA
ncbi:MAG: cation-translocating P-type ATPase [Alysiella sp.]|nr:cation-translocating P-type ATPase [Alysiella sp.]MDO4433478.1 cation-translocating P-type ATPase [Alysiella sp.]